MVDGYFGAIHFYLYANGLDNKKRDLQSMFRKVMLFGVLVCYILVFLFLVEIIRKGYHNIINGVFYTYER